MPAPQEYTVCWSTPDTNRASLRAGYNGGRTLNKSPFRRKKSRGDLRRKGFRLKSHGAIAAYPRISPRAYLLTSRGAKERVFRGDNSLFSAFDSSW